MSELLCTKTHTVMMPRELTAENGAKAALIGEFHSDLVVTCEVCGGEGWFEDESETCAECTGAGSITLKVPVSWTTIKEIYAKAVETLGT